MEQRLFLSPSPSLAPLFLFLHFFCFFFFFFFVFLQFISISIYIYLLLVAYSFLFLWFLPPPITHRQRQQHYLLLAVDRLYGKLSWREEIRFVEGGSKAWEEAPPSWRGTGGEGRIGELVVAVLHPGSRRSGRIGHGLGPLSRDQLPLAARRRRRRRASHGPAWWKTQRIRVWLGGDQDAALRWARYIYRSLCFLHHWHRSICSSSNQSLFIVMLSCNYRKLWEENQVMVVHNALSHV